MNEGEIITIVNQVIGGKTEALEVIDSGIVVEVVLSKPCTITAQDKADFDAHGFHFVDYTTAMQVVSDDAIRIAPCLMFRIME